MNYQEQALASASGVDLIVALYDGWIRFLYRAVEAIEADDVIERRFAIKRSLDILMYLDGCLRVDVGGEPARALTDFYAAMFTMMLEASHAASADELRKVIACVRNVKEAWAVVARDPAANRASQRELRVADQNTPAVTVMPIPVPAAGGPTQPMRWSA